jgi:hypothetical protein
MHSLITQSLLSPTAPLRPLKVTMQALWSKFERFSDQQRLERLQSCQDLSACVKNCLHIQRAMIAKKMPEQQKMDMESCVAGIRMVKYYDWREGQPTRIMGEDDTLQANTLVNVPSAATKQTFVPGDVPPTCAREVHSLWGCRGVALACAPDVIALRKCFHDQGDKEQVLSVPYFGYQEGVDVDKSIPCRELQEQLGKCVAVRATELEERVTSRPPEDEE